MKSKFDRKTLKEMFDGRSVSPILPYHSLDSDRETAKLVAEGNGRISLSGVQAKYSMVVDNGIIRLAERGEQGLYILKPVPTASFILDRDYCPYNEHLTMNIASYAFGIQTAPCCICYFGNGDAAFMVRRFDIGANGTKFAQEDFAQLAGLNKNNGGENFKYDILSYEECAELITAKVRAARSELLKFFRMVVFNYITSNDDAHIKNFSVMDKGNGNYVLTPAYDLMNTAIHLAMPSIFALRKGLFKDGMKINDTSSINRASFSEFGHRIGLPDKVVMKELDMFSQANAKANELISQSGLSDSLKYFYQSTMKYRQSTLL